MKTVYTRQEPTQSISSSSSPASFAGLPSEQAIVFFDGICHLCNGVVDTLLRHDTQHTMLYAPLQGTTYKELRTYYPHAPDSLDTVIVYHHHVLYTQSSAVLHIARLLGGPWKLLLVFTIIPRSIRDMLYRVIARYRYTIFGRHDHCRMPTPDERAYFLP